MDYLRGKLENESLMNVTKTFSRASTVNLKMVQLAQTQKKSLSADLFYLNFKVFEFHFIYCFAKSENIRLT